MTRCAVVSERPNSARLRKSISGRTTADGAGSRRNSSMSRRQRNDTAGDLGAALFCVLAIAALLWLVWPQ